MQPFLANVFAALDEAAVPYCLLRDAHRIQVFDDGGELDVLVDPRHYAAFARTLLSQGCLPLNIRGYAPHRFFIAFDAPRNVWFKFDIVTEVAYGGRSDHLRTDLAGACLASRRQVAGAWAPSPEVELITLLLHIVLDKGQFPPHREERLLAVRHEIEDEAYATRLLQRYWLPEATWPSLAADIDRRNWAGLLAQRDTVAHRLSGPAPWVARLRQIRQRAGRLTGRLHSFVAPTVPSVALLGPDGAGKSTLSDGLVQGFPIPVAKVYMGLYPQNAKKPRRAMPGLGVAGLIIGSWRRYLKGRYRQARGHLVIFDRYPYDALLPSRRRLNPLKRLRRALLARSCPAPDIVVILDAPAEMLHARKGEHTVEILDQQRQAYRALRDRLPNAALVNAAAAADEVRCEVNQLIWRAFQRRAAKGAA